MREYRVIVEPTGKAMSIFGALSARGRGDPDDAAGRLLAGEGIARIVTGSPMLTSRDPPRTRIRTFAIFGIGTDEPVSITALG